MKLTSAQIQSARHHLRAVDPVTKAMIDAVGPYTLRFERDRFSMLVRSIVSVLGKQNPKAQEAAFTIEGRSSIHNGTPTSEDV